LFAEISENPNFGHTLDQKFELMWLETSKGVVVIRSKKFSVVFKKDRKPT
jgi:hypothetical protein